MTKFLNSQAVEFTYATAEEPHRLRIYAKRVCKCPERTGTWRELQEFCLRRDVISYGWRCTRSMNACYYHPF